MKRILCLFGKHRMAFRWTKTLLQNGQTLHVADAVCIVCGKTDYATGSEKWEVAG